MIRPPFHRFADLFPLLGDAERDEVAEDIREHGLRDQIVLLDNAVLDGRNRYLCLEQLVETGEVLGPGWGWRAGAALTAEDLALDMAWFRPHRADKDGDALTFVLSKNLHRRQLNDIQRASVAAKLATLSRGRPSEENPPIGGITTEAAAESLNVAPRQVERARVVHERGVAEVREALDRGEIAVSRAEEIARLPEERQREEVERVLPRGARAIMGSRQEPDDSLDYFPTPPWATRALIEKVLPRSGLQASFHAQLAWEPACGEGHIAEVLKEYFGDVVESDIHDYGRADAHQVDFLAADHVNRQEDADWIITNPPFGDKAEAFVLHALDLARVGVAMFLRLQWLETIGRYESIFAKHPPYVIAQFAERVPLHKGRWEPAGSTATAYLWIVWLKNRADKSTGFMWIPPGQREALTREDDVARFTAHPVIGKPARSFENGAIASGPCSTGDGAVETALPETAEADASPTPCPGEDVGGILRPSDSAAEAAAAPLDAALAAASSPDLEGRDAEAALSSLGAASEPHPLDIPKFLRRSTKITEARP